LGRETAWQKTADVLNAYTNMAFFDGHVETIPTFPLTTQSLDTEKNFPQRVSE